MPRLRSALALVALTVSVPATAQSTATTQPAPTAQPARRQPLDAVVSTAWLAAHHTDHDVLVLHVTHESEYEAGHIPGARKLPYDRLVTRRGPLGTEMPDEADLRALFAGLGVTDGNTIIVHAHEAPMATRALFALAYLGVERIALLDGGLDRWRAEGRPVSKEVKAGHPGRVTTKARPDLIVDAAAVRARLGKRGVALIDTRTDGEYNGTGNRSGMPSAGHLEGARQLQWEELFTDGMTALKPKAELARMFSERVAKGDTVITYCWVGYRASATWFIARWLGYDAKLYDGSYQDWSQRQLPTRPGTTP